MSNYLNSVFNYLNKGIGNPFDLARSFEDNINETDAKADGDYEAVAMSDVLGDQRDTIVKAVVEKRLKNNLIENAIILSLKFSTAQLRDEYVVKIVNTYVTQLESNEKVHPNELERAKALMRLTQKISTTSNRILFVTSRLENVCIEPMLPCKVNDCGVDALSIYCKFNHIFNNKEINKGIRNTLLSEIVLDLFSKRKGDTALCMVLSANDNNLTDQIMPEAIDRLLARNQVMKSLTSLSVMENKGLRETQIIKIVNHVLKTESFKKYLMIVSLFLEDQSSRQAHILENKERIASKIPDIDFDNFIKS